MAPEEADGVTRAAAGAHVATAGSGRGSLPDVLHVIAPGPTGGAESVVRALTAAQQKQGQKVGLVSLRCQEESVPPLVAQARSDGLEVREVVVGHRRYLSELRGAREAIAAAGPEVVHTHGYRADVLGGLAARLEGRPVVSTVHGFTGGGWKNRLFERVQLLAARRFDAVVAVSDPLAEELGRRRVPRGRIEVIPNAWTRDVDHFSRGEARAELGLAGDDLVLGWVGRVSREKGLDVLVRALAGLPDGVVAVVGDGPEREGVSELARRLGVTGRLRWCGRVPDAAPLYRAFDVFVLSSRTEGTPMVVFEAVAAGVPVVATRVGGVPEQVTPRTGWPVPPGEPAALAEAVRSALGEPAEARRRASAALRRLRRRFGAAPWVAAHGALYRRVLRRAEA